MITHQFAKYVIVGLVSNGLLYAVYLLLAKFGVPPKVAMTIAYILGVIQSFAFNRKWTFQSDAHLSKSAKKYALAYFSGYLINLSILFLFVDLLGAPHQFVQGMAIVTIAVYLFLCQRYWVFKKI